MRKRLQAASHKASVGIVEVAQAAGVSTASVSRVINETSSGQKSELFNTFLQMTCKTIDKVMNIRKVQARALNTLAKLVFSRSRKSISDLILSTAASSVFK